MKHVLALALSLSLALLMACSRAQTQEASGNSSDSMEEIVVSDAPVDEDAQAKSNENVAPTVAEEPAPQEDTASSPEDVKPEITEIYYDDLQHGDKGSEYQRYIVLHDTEGGGTPEGVVSSWENCGNLIAAHFVIGKDGSIVRCVPLDKIAHHAGWGSGNANDRFGISEDGRDDLLGRKSTNHYTDYGMNAWSIGIEMIHVGGEGDYPEAQLAALDSLIAYLDTYYGGSAGEIIDHKMWREGNSDTSEEFAAYLANYRDHRTHD